MTARHAGPLGAAIGCVVALPALVLAGSAVRPLPPASAVLTVTTLAPSIHIRIEYPTNQPQSPAILMPEGSRDDLLARGFALVTYDTPQMVFADDDATLASTHVGFGPLASPAFFLGRAYFRMVTRHAEEVVPRIVDALLKLPMIDANRIGIAGTSTQGFIALAAFAAEPRLASAAVVSACPDYVAFLRDSTMGMAGAPLHLNPEYQRWLVANAPVSHASRLAHGPVLLVTGELDRMTPPSCLRDSRETLREAFEDADRRNQLRIRVTPRVGHGATRYSNHLIAGWWSRWLGTAGTL